MNAEKKRIAIIALIVVVSILLGVLSMAGYFRFAGAKMLDRIYEPEMIIPSPDGRYELVVQEWSCLGGAGADVYIREPGQDQWYNSWMRKQIGTASGDDYYQPFSGGTYHVEWQRHQVTICYYRDLAVEDVNDRSTWRGQLVYELE